MATRSILALIFLAALVTLANGFQLREKRQTAPEDCTKPPVVRHDHECCRLPKERIWGDLRKSFQMCGKKFKNDMRAMRQQMGEFESDMATPKDTDSATPTEIPIESSSTTTTSTPAEHEKRPHWRRPHHQFRRSNDSCFIECVFEDQGFLVDKTVNKEALLERLAETLIANDIWHRLAMEAVETCYKTEMATPSDKLCKSKSEEIFRCIFKHMFFNCPNWTQDDYCESVKQFYQKCPNGPPPEMNDQHTTSATDSDMEPTPKPEAEAEGSTDPE